MMLLEQATILRILAPRSVLFYSTHWNMHDWNVRYDGVLRQVCPPGGEQVGKKEALGKRQSLARRTFWQSFYFLAVL